MYIEKNKILILNININIIGNFFLFKKNIFIHN